MLDPECLNVLKKSVKSFKTWKIQTSTPDVQLTKNTMDLLIHIKVLIVGKIL